MDDRNNFANTHITIKMLSDGNIDMHYLSRAVWAALEYYRTGDGRIVAATVDEIETGKAVINCSMQAFGLECALKGVYQAIGKCFAKKHDLSILFEGLPSECQQAIEKNWSKWTLVPETQSMTFRDFIKDHKCDFVNWRYLQGNNLKSESLSLFAATAAVNSTTMALEQQPTTFAST